MFTFYDDSTFNFAVPNSGDFVKQLYTGREIILSVLKRKQFKEIMLQGLEIEFVKEITKCDAKKKKKMETPLFLTSPASSRSLQTAFKLVATPTLGFWFHIKELLGRGDIENIETSSGALISLKTKS